MVCVAGAQPIWIEQPLNPYGLILSSCDGLGFRIQDAQFVWRWRARVLNPYGLGGHGFAIHMGWAPTAQTIWAGLPGVPKPHGLGPPGVRGPYEMDTLSSLNKDWRLALAEFYIIVILYVQNPYVFAGCSIHMDWTLHPHLYMLFAWSAQSIWIGHLPLQLMDWEGDQPIWNQGLLNPYGLGAYRANHLDWAPTTKPNGLCRCSNHME